MTPAEVIAAHESDGNGWCQCMKKPRRQHWEDHVLDELSKAGYEVAPWDAEDQP